VAVSFIGGGNALGEKTQVNIELHLQDDDYRKKDKAMYHNCNYNSHTTVSANISLNSDEFIFRNLTKCKDRFELRKGNVPISYTRMRELFIDAFRPFVSDVKKYGLHSEIWWCDYRSKFRLF
jgi:hypothetical protein